MTQQGKAAYILSNEIETARRLMVAITFCYRRRQIRIHRSVIISMQNPSYIRLLIHREKKVVLIQPCSAQERDAIKVPKSGEKGKTPVFINSTALLISITELMGWSKTQTYRVAGEYLEQEHIAVFALDEAVILKEAGEASCETT